MFPTGTCPPTADLGLRRDEIFEARQIQRAESEAPGIVQEAIDGMIERGDEPTRAAPMTERRKPPMSPAEPSGTGTI